MFRCFKVDFEANFVFFEQKTNHPAFLNEVFRLSDRQHRVSLELGSKRRRAFLLAFSDKKNLASPDLLNLLEMLHSQRTLSDRLSTQARLQCSMKRILSEGAIDNRAVSLLERSFRPIHKLRKMIEKGGFYLVLARRTPLPQYRPSTHQENQQNKNVNRQTRKPVTRSRRSGFPSAPVQPA